MAGAAVGIASNEANRHSRVPYFGFSKEGLFESRLTDSVSEPVDGSPHGGTTSSVSSRSKPLEIVLFFAECEGCKIVQGKVLPKIRGSFGTSVIIREYDCAEMGNYTLLLKYEECFRSDENEMMKMFIGERHYLAGAKKIVSQALPVISRALAAPGGNGQ